MRKILITGANGALAKKVINEFLTDENFEIYASTRSPETCRDVKKGVKYVSNDSLFNTDVLKDIDYVLHCAFPRNYEALDMYSAMSFFENLLNMSIEKGVKNFVNISSQSIYGNYRKSPSTELEASPSDIYALTKYSCERLGLAVAKNSNINFTNIRLASLIGNEFPERVINKMIKFAFEKSAITVQNDKNVLGFMHIEDAAKGLHSFIVNSNPEKWKSVYNFGVKPNYSENLEYIACKIEKLFSNKNMKIDLTVNNCEKADKFCLMESSSFYNDAKWEPEITLENAIEKIFFSII